MVEQILPGLHRIPIPLTFNPLGSVNIYAITGSDGVRLIDSGWNTEEAYSALIEGLRKLGYDVTDIQQIVTTHVHPDHFGLAEQIATESGAELLIHRNEAAVMYQVFEPRSVRLGRMREWLASNGLSGQELEIVAEESVVDFDPGKLPSVHKELTAGAILDWSPYKFEVLWTPGHSGGLVCLYDAKFGVLVSSDHILERISPHIGKHSHGSGNPLSDYIASLRMVSKLPVRVVLPGHGTPFTDLERRVDELILHHQRRLDEMLDVLSAGREQSASQVASRIYWRGAENGWVKLHPFHKRMALDETVAHLEYLASLHRVTVRLQDGATLYSLS